VQKSAAGAIYAAAGGNCMFSLLFHFFPPTLSPLFIANLFFLPSAVANQNELRKANAVAPLTRLLTSSDESVRQTAAGAFYALLLENSLPLFFLLNLHYLTNHRNRESARGRRDSHSQLHFTPPGV
jgi:hypothetical protein